VSVIDLTSSVLVFTFMLMNFLSSEDYKNMYVIASFGVLLMWVKLFYCIGMSWIFMDFILKITSIILEIWRFLFIFFMAILSFANCFFILDRYTTFSDEYLCGGEKFEPIVGNSFREAFRHIYKQTLGETEIDSYEDSYVPTVYLLLFIVCTIILPIILLNVLI